MPTWLVFSLSAAAVAAGGIRLARDGDVIAEETGLGGMWVGAILVAAATSLPELATDANAILRGTTASPWAICSDRAWRTWQSLPSRTW